MGRLEQAAGARQKRVSGKRVGEVRKFGRPVFVLAARGRLGVKVDRWAFSLVGLPIRLEFVDGSGIEPNAALLPRALPRCTSTPP